MDSKERERQLTFVRGQFEIAKVYAMYWHTMAITGAATLRNTAQGCEPTEEEKAKGMCIGWRPHTDMEKIQNAIQVMHIHIVRMNDLNDDIYDLMRE